MEGVAVVAERKSNCVSSNNATNYNCNNRNNCNCNLDTLHRNCTEKSMQKLNILSRDTYHVTTIFYNGSSVWWRDTRDVAPPFAEPLRTFLFPACAPPPLGEGSTNSVGDTRKRKDKRESPLFEDAIEDATEKREDARECLLQGSFLLAQRRFFCGHAVFVILNGEGEPR